ncbi:MASE3 domain-containing protein [Methanoregula sp.]|uniref:MASE3 domain-containing protein n=1 Tax=Methanoregula sp. TaxID=2052170 RepID=UPI00356AB5EA
MADVHPTHHEDQNTLISPANLLQGAFLSVILIVLYLISTVNYLLFHGIVELAGIAVAISIFIIVWNTRRMITDGFFLIVGISFLFFGSIDLVHTLAFKGMGVFPGNSPDLPTQLWIAARYFQSITFLVATFFIGRSITNGKKYDVAVIIAACTAACVLLFASIFVWQNFPACFTEGTGLTLFKIVSEYIISLILIATIVILYLKRDHFDPTVWKFLVAAQAFLILGELAFTSYISVFGFMNMLGHLFRLISVYLFYRAFVVVALTRPYDLLLRELKTDEDLLRESENKLNMIIRGSPIPQFVIDSNHRVIHWNEALEKYSGIKAEEIIGTNRQWRAFYSSERPCMADLLVDGVQEKFHGWHEGKYAKSTLVEGAYEATDFFPHMGLSGIWLYFTAAPIRDSKGSIIGAVETLEDITERKKAEDAVRRSRDYYLKLFDDFPNPIWRSDTNAKCDYFNKEWLAFTGRTFEQERGDGWADGVHPDDLDRCVKTYLAAFNAREPFDMEYRLRHRDGTFHWLLDSGKPFYDPDGNFTGYLGACYDVTGRKTAEEALRLQNRIFETIAEGVYLIRASDGVIVFTNSKFDTMFGYEKGELIGRHVSVVNAPEEKTSPRDTAEEIIKTLHEKGGWRGEVKNIRKDGTTFWCLAAVSTFEHPGFGSVWISAHTDITAHKQAEDAVQAAVKLNQLIDTMSVSECMSYTLDEAERLTSSKIGFFHIINPDEKTIQLIAWSTETRKHCFIPKEPERHYPVEKAGIWVDCIRQRRPVIHNDYASLPHKKGLPEGHVPVIRELVVPIFNEDKIIAIIGVGNKVVDYDEKDISVLTLLAKNTWTLIQRKQVEEALRESEQKFRDIFNNTTDAIHIHEINADGTPGRFTDVNDVACRMLGYTREEMIAKTPFDITTDHHNPPLERVIEEQRMSGTARFETEHRAKDGTIIPVEVNTHIVTIQGTKVMLGVVRDITKRKKAEVLLKHYSEELELEVKARTEELSTSLDEKVLLLREIHHRVKNNLQIIISLVNLQMRRVEDERLKQVMAETQNRVRAMSLVHEKLYQSVDISRIDLAGYTGFLVTHLFTFYGVDSRQVTLKVDIGKIMLDINTAIPLGLIINELASNTLKHAFPDSRKGSLFIAVREDGKTLHLMVRDDGIGMPEDFDWRNAESLGLRLVVSLVEQLEGTIELDRSAGTAFTIIVQEKKG